MVDVAESQAATVVLVHGGGDGAWIWEPLGLELDALGIPHVEVDLPTMGVGVDPALDSHTDAAHVRAMLDRLVGPILLCGNSYGGLVITEASAGHANVVQLVYLAAFMPDADDELIAFVTTNCTPELMDGSNFGDDGLLVFDPESSKKYALQQSAPEVAAWAADRLRPMAVGGGRLSTVSGVGWRTIPSTYVVCTEDLTLQPDSQRRWAAERATDSVQFPFDHCPQLSHPAEVAVLLAKLAAASSQ